MILSRQKPDAYVDGHLKNQKKGGVCGGRFGGYACMHANLLMDKRTLKQALEETYKHAGPDPIYNSLLLAYQKEAED